MSAIGMLQQLVFGKPQTLIWASDGVVEPRYLLRRKIHAS
jgi:hypothetical protein